MFVAIPRHFKRRKIPVLLATVVSLVFLTSTVYFHESITLPDAINEGLSTVYSKSEEYLSQQAVADHFYDNFFSTLIRHSPLSSDSLITQVDNCELKTLGVDFDDRIYTEEQLSLCFQMDLATLKTLKKKHKLMLKLIPLEFPPGFYSGNGIVMVGGGKFSVLLLLSITTIRHSGTTLPIEVFIPEGEEELDDQFCQLIAQMDAKCISIRDILDKEMIDRLQITGYQLKSLLLMASSFENVLLLDADNNLVVNIDKVFDQLPFNTTGLVTWPDYWKRATSPLFYEIAGVQLGDRVRYSIDTLSPVTEEGDLKTEVPMHDRANSIPDGSTESGQLLINKYKHAKTVMLSFYYNYNGPQLFYPLLGQRTMGEGDKDTFLAAAQVCGADFYQVKKPPRTQGYNTQSGFHGTCMLQSDPVKDYQNYHSIPAVEKKPDSDELLVGYNKISKHLDEDIYFIHAHHPKLDPFGLHKDGFFHDDDGKHFRMYGLMTNVGVKFDFEKVQYQAMKKYFCEDSLNLNYIREMEESGIKREEVCKLIEEHEKFLEIDTKLFSS